VQKKLPARLVQKQRRFKQLSRFKQLPQKSSLRQSRFT
jgi:hypothetical protein